MKEEGTFSKKFLAALESRGIKRRDFLKYCAATAAVFGLSEFEFTTRLAQVVEAASKKPPVVWLDGQACTGCTISLAQSLNPPTATIVLDKISIRYDKTIMAGTGDVADHALENAIKEGGYILVFEGSIPSADDRFAMHRGEPVRKQLERAAKKATSVIAVGACSAYGGIPRATVTKGMPVSDVLKKAGINKPIINISTCPVHPDHLVGTILYVLTTGKVPELDKIGRPIMYYRENIHDNCRRRGNFDAGKFLTDWNDPKQKDWCMLQKGCKGPMTYSDCAIRRWNDGINFCIDCGATCQGCAEPGFYAQMTPLYSAESEISKKILAMREAGLIPKKES